MLSHLRPPAHQVRLHLNHMDSVITLKGLTARQSMNYAGSVSGHHSQSRSRHYGTLPEITHPFATVGYYFDLDAFVHTWRMQLGFSPT